ncbi:MAG: hypothetical protein HY094_10520 [Candidatus Melainabacteria bacterium]|nr:hypothetical protein [Candidatus Melainabacteria bacterium]
MSKEVRSVGKQVYKPIDKASLIRQPGVEPSEQEKAQVADKVKSMLKLANITVRSILTAPFLSGVNVSLEEGQSSKISQIIKLLKANGAQKTNNRKEVILDGVVVNVDLVKFYKPARKP